MRADSLYPVRVEIYIMPYEPLSSLEILILINTHQDCFADAYISYIVTPTCHRIHLLLAFLVLHYSRSRSKSIVEEPVERLVFHVTRIDQLVGLCWVDSILGDILERVG